MIKMKSIPHPDPKLSLNIKDRIILFGRIVVQCHGQSFSLVSFVDKEQGFPQMSNFGMKDSQFVWSSADRIVLSRYDLPNCPPPHLSEVVLVDR